jgi:hypothetical protein
MNYVNRILDAFGGPRALAKAGGWPPSTVYDWKYSRSIPAKKQRVIMDLAKAQGIKIKPADFFDL